MPGTIDDPVVLDPFQTIVEVGWPDDIRYLCFQVFMQTTSTFYNDTEYCDPPIPGVPPIGASPGYWNYVWLSSVTYSNVNHGDVSIRRDNTDAEWEEPDEPVEVTLPSAPGSFTHGAWDFMWLFIFPTVYSYDHSSSPELGTALFDLCGSWKNDSGSPTAVTVPGSEEFFETGFSPTKGFWAPPYESSDEACVTDGFLQGTARFYSLDAQFIDEFALPLGSITAVYKGNTYTAMAAFVPEGEMETSGLNPFERCISCWILCERDGTA